MNWINFPAYGSFPGFNIDVGMIFDPLAKGMLLVVTGVGLLVHIFSIGYMAHDPGRGAVLRRTVDLHVLHDRHRVWRRT